MGGVLSGIQLGYWTKEGINCWNDMLMATFREINLRQRVYKGKSGFELAIKELQNFKNKFHRIPRSTDKGMGSICSSIIRGEWKEFGVETWNELLQITFGKINKQRNVYRSKAGLIHAQTILRDLRKQKGRLPNTRDQIVGGILGALKRDEWKDYGITSWNHLLQITFGQVNLQQNIFTGKVGLQRAQDELRELKKEIGYLPRVRDKGMKRIESCVHAKYWKKFGITTWNELLQATFGKKNLEQKIYRDKIGLQRAREKMKEFQENNGRLPKTKDNGMRSIDHAARSKYWAEFGINSWNDLLMKIFGEINRKGNNKS